MSLTVNLGSPYESIIDSIIKRGYAGNQTEVIRQALSHYERYLEEEEVRLVHKAVTTEMENIKSGKSKTMTLDELNKRYSK